MRFPGTRAAWSSGWGSSSWLGMVAALFALFLLTDPSTFRGRYRISTVVEDAGGIRRGDPVQMRGVNVGRVMSFSMAPQGVRITLEIEGAWDIPSDSRSRLVSGGILGGRTVEIVEGGSPAPISGGGEIPGENVAGLLDFPADLGKDAQAVLGQIKNLLAEPTLDAIQGSATELQALLGPALPTGQGSGKGDRPVHGIPQPFGPRAGGRRRIRGGFGQGCGTGRLGPHDRESNQ